MAARVTQIVVEVGDVDPGYARASQAIVETGDVDPGYARISQLVVELGDVDPGYARCSQLVVEILIPNVELPVPLIYPELIGLSFSQIRRPMFSNAIQPHVSQREVNINYAEEDVYEWDLTYESLADFPRGQCPSEIKRLAGFFEFHKGTWREFLFRDRDDCRVAQQQIAITDGIESTYLLVRDYGDPAYGVVVTQAVGYVNLGESFNVYLDGVAISAEDPVNGWQVVTAIPRTQQLKFANTPAAGQIVTVDMSYYFLCRFGADTADFEKFLDRLWLLKSVTIHSKKGGT